LGVLDQGSTPAKLETTTVSIQMGVRTNGLLGSSALVKPAVLMPISGDQMPTNASASTSSTSIANAEKPPVRETSSQHQQQQEEVAPNSSKSTTNTSISLQDLSLKHVLGGGAFGQVWLGVWNGTPVAVKVLNAACQQTSLTKEVLKAFEDEVEMLERLRHPNICLFLCACLKPPNRAIVTELVSRGSLWDSLRTPGLFPVTNQEKEPHWPIWVTRRVLDGTCRGLTYLHSHNPPIIHRDLKSANLLIDDSFNVKICDFGLARLRDLTASSNMTNNVGTMQWMAPEVILSSSYTESCDVYSLGIVIWEVLTSRCPFEELGSLELPHAITVGNKRPPVPAYCTEMQKRLLEVCWSRDYQERPAAAVVLGLLVAAFPLPHEA